MKDRLDVLLVQGGFFQSREKAKAAIMAGEVMVDGQRVDKAGTMISTDSQITLKESGIPYVSRGGLKLEKALDTFRVDPTGLVCVDMGASTGGFTDCLLQRGAKQVFALDVGYGQLDYKLRQDPRVINHERTNIRYMDPALVDPKAKLVTIDVSFISLKHMFPKVAEVTEEQACCIALVKPQFEAGKEKVGKGGIVRDPAVHEEVITTVMDYARENGLTPAGLTFSPIHGAKGNIEYLLYVIKGAEEGDVSEPGLPNIKSTIAAAFES